MSLAPLGRDQEFAQFLDAVNRATGSGRQVLVFYGPGGQGKTELCSSLVNNYRNRRAGEAKHPICLVDFKLLPTQSSEALYAMRWALNSSRHLYKPAFDVAFIHYQRRLYPGLDIRQKYPELFHENRRFSDTGDFADILLDLATSTATHVPFLGLLEKYSRRIADHIGAAHTRRMSQQLNGLEDWSDAELHRRLPILLADDVSHLAEDGEVPIILFDHFEHLWPGGFDSNPLGRRDADLWVRDFCANLSRGVCGIFCREGLSHWTEDGAAGFQAGDFHRIELPGLSNRSAVRLLKNAGMTDPAVRKHILRLAGGHPLFLTVQIDTWRAIGKQGRVPSVADFGTHTGGIINRFLDHLDPRARICLCALAFPDFIDENLFEHLANRIPNAFAGFSFADIRTYSFFNMHGEGRAVMHTVMRNGLRKHADARFANRLHEELFAWFDGQWAALDDGQAVQANLLFENAAAHKRRRDEKAFLAWLLAIEETRLPPLSSRVTREALEVAQKHAMKAEAVACLWLLSFVTGERKPSLARAVALLEEGIDPPPRRAAIIVARHIDALVSDAGFDEASTRSVLAEASRCARRIEGEAGLPPHWSAHVRHCLAMIHDMMGDFDDRQRLYEDAYDALQAGSSLSLAYSIVVARFLANIYVAAERYEDARRIARSTLTRCAQAAQSPAATALDERELAAHIGVAAVASELEGFEKLAAASDEELGRVIALPQPPEDLGVWTCRATVASVHNIGLVVNARGKLCLVHDSPFCTSLRELHVRYSPSEKCLYICFNRDAALKIEWEATDEMDSYLSRADKMLMIRMFDKRPVEGYDVSVLVCDGPQQDPARAGENPVSSAPP